MKIKPILLTLAVVIPTAFSFAQGPGGRPPGPPPGGGGQEQGRPPRPPGPPPILVALDKDDDGIISAKEIAEAPDSLKTLDKNGDGQLTPDEYLGPKGGGHKHPGKGAQETAPATSGTDSGMGHTMDPAAPKHSGKDRHGPPLQLIEALDANGNGVISADEITNASAALLTLDKNGDGQLGPREYGPKPPPIPKELQSYDKNGDGKLDASEREAVQADIQSGKLKPPQLPQKPEPPEGDSGPQ
jgi:hypothetical protein